MFLEKQKVSCTLAVFMTSSKGHNNMLVRDILHCTAQCKSNYWVLSKLPKSYEVTKLRIFQTFHYNYQPAHASHSSIDWVKQEQKQKQKQAKHIEGRKRQTVIVGDWQTLASTNCTWQVVLGWDWLPRKNHQHCSSSSSHSLTSFPLMHCSLHLLDSHGNPLHY